jgi:hypothetical protein
MSDIDKALQIDHALRPNFYDRAEAIARIIDPAAFADDWIIEPEHSAKLHALKLNYLRGVAMRKAQDVLEYLGVNSEVDWMEILTRMAESSGSETRRKDE